MKKFIHENLLLLTAVVCFALGFIAFVLILPSCATLAGPPPRTSGEIVALEHLQICSITTTGVAIRAETNVFCPQPSELENIVALALRAVSGTPDDVVNSELIIQSAPIVCESSYVNGCTTHVTDEFERTHAVMIVQDHRGWQFDFRHELGHVIYEGKHEGNGDHFHLDCEFWKKLELRACNAKGSAGWE